MAPAVLQPCQSLICWCQARITCFAARAIIMHDRGALSAAIKRAISISSN
jgi:hypothetical protein